MKTPLIIISSHTSPNIARAHINSNSLLARLFRLLKPIPIYLQLSPEHPLEQIGRITTLSFKNDSLTATPKFSITPPTTEFLAIPQWSYRQLLPQKLLSITLIPKHTSLSIPTASPQKTYKLKTHSIVSKNSLPTSPELPLLHHVHNTMKSTNESYLSTWSKLKNNFLL